MSGLGKLGLRRGFLGTGGLSPAQSRHRVFVQAALMEGLSEALKADICAFPVIFAAPSIAASGAKHTRKASNEVREERERGRPRCARGALGAGKSAGKAGHKQNYQWKGTAFDTILHLNSPWIRALEAQGAGAQ